MLKNKYISALFLVGVCVIALIAVQLMWISDAFTLKHQQLQKEIKSALPQVAIDFEDALFCHELFTNVKINPGEGLQLLQKQWKTDSTGKNIWQSNAQDTINLYHSNADESLQTFDGLKFYYPSTIQIVIKINTWFDSAEVFNKEGELQNSILDKDPDVESFKKLVSDHHNPKYLFEDNYVDTLISDILIQNDVDLDFEFGIFNKNDELVYKSQNADLNQLENSTLKEELLGNNYFFDPLELRMYLPDESSYLLKGSIVFLVVSILIIITLVFAFFLFARFLLRQVELNQMKSNFVNNMTHEFKTPIANISLALEHIDMQNNSFDSKLKKYLDIIHDENRRMNTNVERILEVAKYSNTKEGQINKEKLFLNDILNEIGANFSLSLEKVGGELQLQTLADNDAIEGDAFHLKNAFSNILDNAIKYNDKKQPIIKITSTSTNEGVKVIFEDNGIGIDKRDLTRIFDPFFRRNTGNVHNVKGFGLGLSYVNRVISMHQGDIKVQSKMGEGSIFIVNLPHKIKKQNYESAKA